MEILNLFITASIPVLKVLLITALGSFLALDGVNIMGEDARKHLNTVVFYVFNPALVSTNLARTITYKSMLKLWFMPVNILITFIIGSILGWILIQLTKPPKHLRGLILGSCAAGNLGYLLLIIVAAVCEEKGSPFGAPDVCHTYAMGYASLSMAIGAIYLWSYVYNIMRISAKMGSEDVTQSLETPSSLSSNSNQESCAQSEPLLSSTMDYVIVEDNALLPSQPKPEIKITSGKVKERVLLVFRKLNLKTIFAPSTIGAVYCWFCNRSDSSDSVGDSVNGSGSEPVSFKHFLSTELFKTGGRIPTSKIMTSLDTENSVQKPRQTSTYNALIDLYGKAGRLDDAAKVFEEMVESGVAMDVITFNTMIFTCGSHGHLSEAEALLSKMEERGISPDTRTYNIFLSLYADVGNIDAALNCYRKIREVGLSPDVVSHRTILHVLCERNMVGDVEAVIEDMEKSGVPIDEHSVPGVIKMYSDHGQLDQAKLFYEKYQLNGDLSSKTCAAIIDAYAEKGFCIEAEAVFYRKRDSVRQKKDAVEYNVMIKAYGKAKLYDKALSLFKGMRNHGTWPDKCTYNSLIQMFTGGDLVDQAKDVLTEMREMGFKPHSLTLSALIACCARLGQLSDAVEVYQDLVNSGVEPNEFVYGSLINGFVEAGRVEEALKYFRQMEESGIPANQIVLTSLIKAYGKVDCLDGAKVLYERLKNLEGPRDIVASNSMINLYADLGMVSDAKLIFEDLRAKGWADEISYAIMIYLYKSVGLLDEAIDVADEMKESGLIRDCGSYNKVMSCYAINGQLRECGELLQEMVTRKLLPDNGTFKVLFTILKKSIPIEAVTQLELSYDEGKPYSKQAIVTSVFSVVGMHAMALESCEKFAKADVSLDSFLYNVAIHAYGTAGEIDKALNLFMRMQDEGLEPDLVTYINLVRCYGKAGMVQGVKRIYSQLKFEEIEPNASLFEAVRYAYTDANRPDLAKLVSQEMRYTFDSEHQTASKTEDDADSGLEDL